MTSAYTPRPQSRTSHLGLSNKQLNKITGTIENVRRNRQSKSSSSLSLGAEHTKSELNRLDTTKAGTRGGAVNGHPVNPIGTLEEPSFVAESTFVRAPLNPRVASRVVTGPLPTISSKGKEKERDPSSLHGISLEIQEALVLEDLLSVLMGVAGTYIVVHPSFDPEYSTGGIPFYVTPTLDPSLRDVVERILPLATYYTAICDFIQIRSQLECGLVNHALCASIRDMLKDYLTLISQLEHLFNTSPSFTLQKLWFYVHPTLHTLSCIHSLTVELLKADDTNLLGVDENEETDDEVDEIDAMNEELGLGIAKKKLEVPNSFTQSPGIIKGGEVVTILWERMMNMSGDPTAHELYRIMFQRASLPYSQMLERWITTGHLRDQYEEFMVKESKFINKGIMESDYNDDYWERRYTLRDGSAVSGQQTGVPKARSEGGRLPGGACIPPILNVWKHKVLLAGKYLNVIRECGIDIPPAVVMDENVVMGDDKFYNAIEDAYTHANRTLLELLVKDQQLIPRLRSLRFYYFLTRSAFISAFFENARAELTKTAFRGASLSRLQSLFDLALVGSDDMNAAFRGDVRLSLAKVGLYDFLQKVLSVDGGLPGIGDAGALGQILNDDGVQSKGKQVRNKDKGEKDKDTPQVALDAITLDYTVKFPLSLVISRKTLLHYQFIFRFLFHIKSTEQALSDMWLDHKSRIWTTRTKHQGLEMWKLRVIVLRGRMMDFVTQLLAFVTGDILEMNWGRLETKLEAAETVDQILKDHTDFLQSCLKGCMLTDTKFLKTLQSLLHTCFRFTVYSQKLTKSLESTTNAVEKKDPALIDSHMKKQWDLLRKFEVNFSHMLRSLMDKVQFEAQNEPTMVPLFTRLTASQPRILPPL